MEFSSRKNVGGGCVVVAVVQGSLGLRLMVAVLSDEELALGGLLCVLFLSQLGEFVPPSLPQLELISGSKEDCVAIRENHPEAGAVPEIDIPHDYRDLQRPGRRCENCAAIKGIELLES